MSRSSDNRRNIKIAPHLYDQISDVVKKEKNKGNNTTIYEEVNRAVENYTTAYNQDDLIANSKLALLLDQKLTKHDKHIASMLGRTGVDVSMALIGIANILIELYGDEVEVKVTDVLKNLRSEGVSYYTNK
jgi:hypothetical protein